LDRVMSAVPSLRKRPRKTSELISALHTHSSSLGIPTKSASVAV